MYNDSASPIHKMTIEMEKLHNKLISGIENQNRSASGVKERFGKIIQDKKPENLSIQ